MEQIFYETLDDLLEELQGKKVFLVCGNSFDRLEIARSIAGLNPVRFSGFSPNPVYEDICAGVDRFRTSGCDAILAVGGGSALDTAKCIKLFAPMKPGTNYLQQPFESTSIPLFAIPTTAGTGSESTRHAVIYFGGEKQSVSHPGIVPDGICLIPEVLKNVPLYQKKCTLMDALCQAIESWWSVSATEESIGYSRAAIVLIRDHWKDFLDCGNYSDRILLASNYAGRAINITATTAPHAMSYKLTSLYGIPHGHAVALSMEQVWASMLDNPNLQNIFRELPVDLNWFRSLVEHMKLEHPVCANKNRDLEILTASVNPLRLRNNPVAFTSEALRAMYERIVL